MGERNPYLSLKKHDMPIVEDAMEIDDKVYTEYLQFFYSKANKFKKIFKTVNKNGSLRYIQVKSPIRYSIGGYYCDLKN